MSWPLKVLTQDPDALSEAFSTDGRRLEFRPLGGDNVISAVASIIRVGQLIVWKGATESGFKLCSLNDTEDYTIFFPGSGTAKIHTQGQTVVASESSGAAYRLSSGDFVEYSPHSESVWIKISRAHLTLALSEELERPLVRAPVLNGTFSIESSGAQQILALSRCALSLDAAGHPITGSPLCEFHYEQALAGLILETLSEDYRKSREVATPTICPKQVRRVLDYVDANASSQLSVVELARIANVSPRALQYSFQTFVGCSPMQYVSNVRLSRARADLLNPDSSLTIAEVAKKWGFMSPSRFSVLIRSAFGETPRELQKRRR